MKKNRMNILKDKRFIALWSFSVMTKKSEFPDFLQWYLACFQIWKTIKIRQTYWVYGLFPPVFLLFSAQEENRGENLELFIMAFTKPILIIIRPSVYILWMNSYPKFQQYCCGFNKVMTSHAWFLCSFLCKYLTFFKL